MKNALFYLSLTLTIGCAAQAEHPYYSQHTGEICYDAEGREILDPRYVSGLQNHRFIEENGDVITLHPDNPTHPHYTGPQDTDSKHRAHWWYPGFEKDEERYNACLEREKGLQYAALPISGEDITQ